MLRLLAALALVAVAQAAIAGDCGGHLDTAEGTIDFHRGSSIPANLQCRWTIRVPRADSITLTFHSMFLSTSGRICKQQLNIIQGLPGNESEVLGQVCGKRGKPLPEPIKVAGDAVTIYLVAPFASRGQGFYLDYTAEVRPMYCFKPTQSLSLSGDLDCAITDEFWPWTIVQRRFEGDVLFNRNWSEYQAGFGHLDGDYWIGLDAIREMCPEPTECEVRIEFEFHDDVYYKWGSGAVTKSEDGHYYAQWGEFGIAGSEDNYRLSVGKFQSESSSPGIGDHFSGHSGEEFTTIDKDNDNMGDNNCAERFGGSGGWWFHSCHTVNLNGEWGHASEGGITYRSVTGPKSAVSSMLMVRPCHECK